jgi:hypothetical protein
LPLRESVKSLPYLSGFSELEEGSSFFELEEELILELLEEPPPAELPPVELEESLSIELEEPLEESPSVELEEPPVIELLLCPEELLSGPSEPEDDETFGRELEDFSSNSPTPVAQEMKVWAIQVNRINNIGTNLILLINSS